MDWSLYPNFRRDEFDSPDVERSGENMQPEFMGRLQAIRTQIGRPMVVTSGYRTKAYNDEIYRKLGKTPTNSAHLRGYAADVAAGSASLRYDIIAAALRNGITRIGVGKSFIHLDLDPSLPQRVIWTY